MLKRKKAQGIRIMLATTLAVTLMSSAKVCVHAEEAIIVNPTCNPATREELREMVEKATEEFYQNNDLKQELENEIQVYEEVIPTSRYDSDVTRYRTITHGGKSMKYLTRIIGEPAANGKYPLYILLHGGGGTEPQYNNDSWFDVILGCPDAVDSGIFIACRGITDTWDMHFQEDSYPLYDRLIEHLIVNLKADPDRVYLYGYSAGGDGVYQITPRLADRFAAVNMSSGHPNNVSLLNVSNCYFNQQAGVRDYYSEDAMRSINVSRYGKILSDYQEKYGFGYEHRTFIHVPDGHLFYDYDDTPVSVLKEPEQFADRAVAEDALSLFLDVLENRGMERDVVSLSYYFPEDDKEFDDGIRDVVTNTLGLATEEANTNAFHYLSSYTRKSAPEKLVWDLSTRASKREKDSFYWLEAAPSVNKGIITASYDAATNTITVNPDKNVNGDFAILFHPDLIDVTRLVTIKTPEVTREVVVNPSAEFLKTSIYECGDPGLGCVGKIMYSELNSGNVPSGTSDIRHTHKFTWETIEATEDTDGELRYQCEICGEIQTRVPLTAYNVFNKNATEKIRNAKKDATVKIETRRWISFHKMVMEALAERPDVTLEISFLDEGHKGKRCTVVIPKGTDTVALVDKNGFTGFLYLGSKFGIKTD